MDYKSMPGHSKAAPMAMSRSHGQMGTAMKTAHAKTMKPAKPARPPKEAKVRGTKTAKQRG